MTDFLWKIGETVFKDSIDNSEKAIAYRMYKRIDGLFDNNEILEKDNLKNTNNKNEDSFSDISKSDDDSSYNQLPSIGECLFGFHSMALIAEAVEKNNYNLDNNPIDVNLAPVFQFIPAIRKMITDMDLSLSTSISNNEKGMVAKQTLDFIAACRKSISNQIEINRDDLDKEYPLVFNDESDLGKVALSIVEYVAMASETQDLSQPYYLYEKLAVCVSPEIIKQRRKIIRQVSYANKYQPSRDGLFACQIVLNDEEYYKQINNSKPIFVSLCSNIGSQYLNMNTISDRNFAKVVDSMRKCIYKGYSNIGDGTTPPFSEYIDSKRCFAIMDNGNKRFISFSCAYDATVKKIINYFGINPSEQKVFADLEKDINRFIRVDPLLKKSKLAKLNLNVITNMPPKQTLDMAINTNREAKRKEFSCCERKMISKTSPIPNGKCYMFIRHKPCPNCQVSIARFDRISKKVEVYYLNEDTSNIEDKRIHRYLMKRGK